MSEEIEVVLFGNDDGIAQSAERLKVTHVPNVATNEYGTPLVNHVFEEMRRISSRPYLCFLNADIILTQDLIRSTATIPFKAFLMLGQRWDCDIGEELDFSLPETERFLRQLVKNHGSLHPPTGSDYFLFSRSIDWELPPFAIGRPTWDNWLIHRARTMGLPVIDASSVVMIIHQNHDYRHVPFGSLKRWEGPEADRNRELTARTGKISTLSDATHVLLPERVKKLWRNQYPWPQLVSMAGRLALVRFLIRATIKFGSVVRSLRRLR